MDRTFTSHRSRRLSYNSSLSTALKSNIRTASWSLLCLNYAGAFYTSIAIVGIAAVNLLNICPTIFENCFIPNVFATYILFSITINLFFFHYHMKNNQVQYWTAKSSSLFLENNADISTSDDFFSGEVDTRYASVNSNENISLRPSLWSVQNRPQFSLESDKSHQNRDQQIRIPRRDGSLNKNCTRPLNNFEKIAFFDDGIYRPIAYGNNPLNTTKGHLPNHTIPFNAATKYCYDCHRTVPRRCHHCPICGICILRKDHHCFLLSGCAGLSNQRYFIVFLFWATIGSMFGTVLNFIYLNRFVSHWYPIGWTTYIGPIALVRWFLGYDSLGNAGLAITFSMSFASAFGAGAFFIFQIIYTLTGCTMHDYHARSSPLFSPINLRAPTQLRIQQPAYAALQKQIDIDGDTWSERLALVFGRRWLLNFLFPQFWLANEMTQAIARNIFLSVPKDL